MNDDMQKYVDNVNTYISEQIERRLKALIPIDTQNLVLKLEKELTTLRAQLSQAIEALEFTVQAAEYLYKPKVELPRGLSAMFYHTLTYEGDLELIKKTMLARFALEKLAAMRDGNKSPK